jgi:protein-tyrosine phosphatase
VSELGLFEQYRVLVDDYSERLASAVAAIADAPPGCVVVNCHAGKDRTGVVVALTLYLEEQHGGTSAYLRRAGMTAGQLGDLCSRLTG